MPLMRCEDNGKVGWKWGDSGHCYFGKDAKKKAMKQGRAIEANRAGDGEIETRALPLDWQEADVDGTRQFRATLATENAVPMPDWKRMEMVPEVLLMRGARLPADGVLPLLNSHEHRDILQQLGTVRGVSIDGQDFVGSLAFSETGDGARVRQMVEEKHARHVSIGYKTNEKQYIPESQTRTIMGRSFAGPVNVVTAWTPLEVSMVPLPADAAARLRGFAQNPFDSEEEEDFVMDAELRSELVTRGMSAELDDEAAQKWASDFLKNIKVPDEKAETEKRAAAEAESKRATQTEDPAVVFERLMEKREAARAEIAAECRTYRLNNEEIEAVLTRAADLPAARKAILEELAKRQGKEVRGTVLDYGDGQGQKHMSALRSAVVGRALDGASINAERQKQLLPEKAAGWEDFRYASMLDIAKQCLEMRGINTRGLDPMSVAQLALDRDEINKAQLWNVQQRAGGPSMHTTGSFPSLMLDAVNKTLLGAYAEVPATWRTVFRQAASVPDFKQIHRLRMGEVPNMEAWPDDTVPAQVRLADSKESYAVQAYALGTSMSYQSIINDDRDAFSRIPALMGAAAARTVNAVAWAVVTANPTLQDGQALFSAATGNRKKANLISSGSGAPTIARIGNLNKLMRLQVGHNTPENNASDAILNIQPRYIVVPAELETTTTQLINSQFDPVANVFQQFNPFRFLTPIVEPLLDANSTAKWYLFADTAQIDTIEVTFLQGQESPVTSTWMDNETHGMKIDIIQTFAAKAIDFRGCARDDGVA